MLAVRIEGLSKIFGSFTALNGLSLGVEEGTIFGFLGPNGAGKTTTIRILTGLAHASSGKAWINGVEVGTNHNDVARQIGFLPEEPAFYTWMTPREFLNYVGEVFNVPAKDRLLRIDELLTLAGLQESAKRRIGGFSRDAAKVGVGPSTDEPPDRSFIRRARQCLGSRRAQRGA